MLARARQESVSTQDIADNTDATVGIYNSTVYGNDSTVSDATYYLLQNENNVLNMYEVSGDNKKLIKSIALNSAFLPAEDRENLKKGIKFTDKEYGYNLIEDYTSWK